MNAQIRSNHNLTRIVIGSLFIILAVLALFSCSTKALEEWAACSVDMDKLVTIDVTDVEPQVVIDQFAQDPDCAITVSPYVSKHVTLHVENATVSEVLASVCSQTNSKYTYDGRHLVISPLTWLEKRNYRAAAEWHKKFEMRMPTGMYFEDARVSYVLAEISKVSGLEITPWPGEGSRKVTLDISGMTVDEALKAVVIQIDGEGAVMVKTWTGGFGEHRLVNK
jgi:hypothetical protein